MSNHTPAIHDTLVGLGACVIVEPHFDCIKDFQNAGESWDQILDFKRRAQGSVKRLGVFALYVDAKDPAPISMNAPTGPTASPAAPSPSPPAATCYPKTPATTKPSSPSTSTRRPWKRPE